MEDEFFVDNMIIYIEKKIAENFNIDSIINEFKNMMEERQFFKCVICFIITTILNYVFILIVLITTIQYINFECILALHKY